MILLILQHTPAWVFGLLIALIAVGISQTREREVGLLRITVLPLVLAALSFSSVFKTFGHLPIALAGWVAGIAFALGALRRAVAVTGATWSAETQRLRVPGSWWPLVLIVGLFTVKYLANVGLAMVPALASEPVFAGGCSLAYGLFSGLFLARAGSIGALARRPAMLRSA